MYWIAVLYVIPAVISWTLSRKYAIITGYRPTDSDLIRTLMPIGNIFAIFIIASWIREKLPGKRSLIEAFYAIKPEDYWNNEESESEGTPK